MEAAEFDSQWRERNVLQMESYGRFQALREYSFQIVMKLLLSAEIVLMKDNMIALKLFKLPQLLSEVSSSVFDPSSISSRVIDPQS
jgi:hypothetical protein